MTTLATGTQYQLKLKERDLIQVTITDIRNDYVQVDTSGWANVETAEVTELAANPSLRKQLYARVADLDSNTASLNQEQGLYKRNHLPGDRIRVRGVENISTNLCRVKIDDSRNLDTIYVVGITAGADVTAEIRKVRGSTAIALPEIIHTEGVNPGQLVAVQTKSGSRQATLTDIGYTDDQGSLPQISIKVQLSEPAKATGTAEAYVTELEGDTALVEIDSYPVNLPNSHDEHKTTVKQGQGRTTVNIGNSDVDIRVNLSHLTPINGTVLIELTHSEQGIYQGDLREYTSPPISVGDTFDGLAYASQNKGRIEYSGRKIPVVLTSDISTSGAATLRIVDLSEKIRAEVHGEISEVSFEETNTATVDMTNISKL